MRVVRAARLVLCVWRGSLILTSIYGDTESDDSEPVEDVEFVEEILDDIARGCLTTWRWDHIRTYSAVILPKDFYARHLCD